MAQTRTDEENAIKMRNKGRKEAEDEVEEEEQKVELSFPTMGETLRAI